jgi:hypothetical protein
VLETKTAEEGEHDRLRLSGGVWVSEHHRREKICGLDVGRADKC